MSDKQRLWINPTPDILKAMYIQYEKLLNNFKSEMMRLFLSHLNVKQDSYKNCTNTWLEGEMLQQLSDYFKYKDQIILLDKTDSEATKEFIIKAKHELVSVANLACMLWNLWSD